MNIQPSLVIWTIICFIALYFVLKYLLFKPVISVMDKRAAKTEELNKTRAEAEEKLRLSEEEQQAKEEMLKDEARKICEAEAERIRKEGKQALDDAKKERIRTVEDYRKKADDDFKTDIAGAESELDKISVRFLERLYSSRD